jgi:hypothetical protein
LAVAEPGQEPGAVQRGQPPLGAAQGAEQQGVDLAGGQHLVVGQQPQQKAVAGAVMPELGEQRER